MPTIQQLTARLEDLHSELEALRYYRRKKLITAPGFASQKAKIQRSIDVAEDRLYDANRKAREATALVRIKAQEEALRKRKADAKAKREAKSIAKRTYILTQEYVKDKFVFDTGKKFGGGDYRQIPEQSSTHTHTETIVRNKGESMDAFVRRATRRSRDAIDDMNADQGGEAGDTIFQYKASGGVSISAGGGGGAGMTRAKPWAYENSGFYSIAEEGRCVPNSLVQIYPKKTYDYFVSRLFPNGDDSVPCLAEWIYNWCVKCDITVLGCNENYEVLMGEETNVPIEYYSKSYNNKPLYFVQKDNHFYVMNKDKALSIVKSRANSIKKAKEEKTIEMTKIFMEEDLKEIDFKIYENTHLIVRHISYVKSYLIEYMKLYHTVPKLQFGVRDKHSIYLKSFMFGTNKMSFDPHFNTVKSLSEKLDIPINSMRAVSNEYAMQTIGVLPKSFMNNKVMDIFLTWKQRQHYAHLFSPKEWEKVKGVEQTWDMNKQYTNILRNSEHNWLLFDMFSLPNVYSGTIGDCYYFVETENTMPCKGNGWYSRVIVEYLIAEGIEHTITHEIKAANTLKPDIFVPFVDKVMADVPDGFKYITNTFCGALNTHKKETASVQSTADKSVVIEKCLTKGASMCKFDVGDDAIYCAATIKSDLLYENNMPMYSQILDTAAVHLAKGIKHLEAKGCVIRSYNTDSITFKAIEKLEIDLPTSALGGWKTEQPKPHEWELPPKQDVKIFTMSDYVFAEDLKETDFDLVGEYVEGGATMRCSIVDYLKVNNAFVNAPAGFGKSWIAEKVIEAVGAEKCAVLGYTNIAANNIGGSTFHKTFKISIDDYKGSFSVKDIMKDKDVLIIDEISQVPAKLYKIMEEAKKLGKRVLIFGDLKQILPVGEDGDGLQMLTIICENRITLTTYRRGDTELLEALTKVREHKGVHFEKGEKGLLHFCFTKARRDKINEREMMKVTKGYYDLPKNDNLKRIYPNMPLRSTITKGDGSMLNGERWIVAGIHDEIVHLQSLIRSNTELRIHLDEISKSFVPGYAMTIHSSQGLTIKEPYTVHIENRSAFSEEEGWRMIYTAVSRSCKKGQVGVVFH